MNGAVWPLEPGTSLRVWEKLHASEPDIGAWALQIRWRDAAVRWHGRLCYD